MAETEREYVPTLVERIAEAIPAELTATPHVGVGSARRLKIASAVLPIVEAEIRRAVDDERERNAAEARAPAAEPSFADDVTDFVEQHGYALTDWQKRYLRAQFHEQENELRRRNAGTTEGSGR